MGRTVSHLRQMVVYQSDSLDICLVIGCWKGWNNRHMININIKHDRRCIYYELIEARNQNPQNSKRSQAEMYVSFFWFNMFCVKSWSPWLWQENSAGNALNLTWPRTIFSNRFSLQHSLYNTFLYITPSLQRLSSTYFQTLGFRKRMTKPWPESPFLRSYCWWFRNPQANHLGCVKNLVNNGVSTTKPQLGELTGFLVAINLNIYLHLW